MATDEDTYRRLEEYDNPEGVRTPLYQYQHVGPSAVVGLWLIASRDRLRRCFGWRLNLADWLIRSGHLSKNRDCRGRTTSTWQRGIFNGIPDGMTYHEAASCTSSLSHCWKC